MVCEERGAVLKAIPFDERGVLDLEAYQKLLGPQVRFVSVVHVSNSLGTVNPAKKIVELAHAQGIPVMLDGAQAVPHGRVDVRDLGADFYAFSGHKLFGPTGVGVLWGRKALLDAMPPYQGGGDMIRTVSFKKTTYAALPNKFEAGTPNIAGVIGLGAVVDYLNGIDFDGAAAWEQELLAYGTKVLSEIGGLRLIGTAPHKAAVLSFVLENVHPHDIGTIVDQQGVAIRTGQHCTEPVMEHFGITATARASLAFYNTKEEIDRLAQAIAAVKEVFS
jgi:cysteine desulfurase/selenocysteine lyase